MRRDSRLRTCAPLYVAALLLCPSPVGAAGQSAPPEAAIPAERHRFHVYLLMGQSNMAGRGSLDHIRDKRDPRVLSFERGERWGVAQDPIHEQRGRTLPGVGPGIAFARAMADAQPGVTVGLVPCAIGGSSLKDWTRGSKYYDRALSRAQSAAASGVIKGVLWHQGETDSASERSAGAYSARLNQMISDLRQDLGAPSLPVVVRQLGHFLEPEKSPFADVVRGAIERVVSSQSVVGFADSTGLTDKGDSLHFCAESQQVLGQRYAEAMLPLVEATQSASQEGASAEPASPVYDATIDGREILTPAPGRAPRLTGPVIFGVRPAKPIRFRASATGAGPITFFAEGLPHGVVIDPQSGWITGRAPDDATDLAVTVRAESPFGADERTLTLRVGPTICLTPPLGWNSWYVHSEGVSETAIREIAAAMEAKGLADHGWTYVNIDDCWMGQRDPETKAIQPNGKFDDMKSLVDFVNSKGLKLGLYSTPWMSTYAGYIGGSAPNGKCDYSAYFIPQQQRLNPHQVFGRYPNGIKKGLCKIGPVWLVDRDARQFAEWGIDYVKYDWKEWTLVNQDDGFAPDEDMPQIKTSGSGIAQRLRSDFLSVDRDIVLSLSPRHDEVEDRFVSKHCNLWRMTNDIRAEWRRLQPAFDMLDRLSQTRPGSYGDLDMLQIGPLGKPNRAEVVFRPSPLKPAEQYFQVTLWCMLTQPLLLSCHIPTMDDFDLNLVCNDEVLAVDQDALCSQGYRVSERRGEWQVLAKNLAGGAKAFAFFNLSRRAQVIHVCAEQLGVQGVVRDLWRQRDCGELVEGFSARVSPHGAAMFRVEPPADDSPSKPAPVSSTPTT